MSKKRKQRLSERWRQRVDLVRSGRSLEALARDFDRSAATIRKRRLALRRGPSCDKFSVN